MAAVDIAWWDPAAQAHKMPLYRWIEEPLQPHQIEDLGRQFRRRAPFKTASGESLYLPVAPHHFPELMTPLLGASPNALYIEYLPYFVDGMFEQAPVIDLGMIRPLDVPGHGIRFQPDLLKTAQ